MGERRPLFRRLANRLFASPAVAQAWARRMAAAAASSADGIAGIPFTPLGKPLRECRVALVTTGGVHLRNQPPFNVAHPDGDASFREIPADTAADRLTITHPYYDHGDADRDIHVVFPLPLLRALSERGVVGSLAAAHYGLMGHIDGAQLPVLIERTAPEVARRLAGDAVDVALLAPA